MELKEEIRLSNESVDLISEKVTEFLENIKMERKNILRIRLLVEEILLDWQEHFSENIVCNVKMGSVLESIICRWKFPEKNIIR